MKPRLSITALSLALSASFLSIPAHGQSRGGNGGDEGGTAGTRGAEPFSMEVVSRWGGPVNDVEVVGNIAYIGSGSRFVVLDVTNPTNITELGSLDLIVTVMDIAIQGNMALVVTMVDGPTACQSSYGFCRVNITNPAQPTLDSHDDIPGVHQLRRVSVFNTTAFVSLDVGVGVETFDLAPPQINHVGDLEIVTPQCIHVEGNLLFAASGGAVGQSLRIYNLHPNPTQPVLIGEAPYPPGQYRPRFMDVSNGVVAITAEKSAFPQPRQLVMLFDASDPAQPLFKSEYDEFVPVPASGFVATVIGVALDGDYALVTQSCEINGTAEPYVWQAAEGLVVLNISDLANPTKVTSVSTHAAVRDVRVFGNRAYVMDDGEGLIVFDISNPANPQRVGVYLSPAHIRHMVKDGNRLYVADKWNGFTILDVSNPLATPVVLGRFETPFVTSGPNQNTRIDHVAIAYYANRVYLMTNTFGIQVVDVSNPAAPLLIEELSNPVVNVPGAGILPTVGRTLKVNGSVLHATYMHQSCASLACTRWYFATYDISDPKMAVTPLIGFSVMEQSVSGHAPNRLALQSPSIAHGSKHDHAATIDTGSPTFAIASIESTSEPADGMGVDIQGATRFVVSGSNSLSAAGLYIQDMAIPTNPVPLARINFDTPGVSLVWAWDVAAQDGRAYVFGMARPNAECPNYSHSCVTAFDVTNPSSPTLLGHVAVPSDSQTGSVPERGILIADEPYLYAAGGDNSGLMPTAGGLSVIKINGLPSDCPADINNSGAVDVDDLIAVILSWGCTSPPQSGGCPADINNSGTVDVDDLIAVILNWGTCD